MVRAETGRPGEVRVTQKVTVQKSLCVSKRGDERGLKEKI